MSGSSIFGAMRGVIASFDDPRGLGVIRSEDGRSFPFHCTAIADGTRTIGEGRTVSFVVVAGHLGQWEASVIVSR